jgi:hypothetical protein
LCWEFFPIVFKLQMSSIADIRRSTRPFVDDKKEDDFFQIDVRFLLNILVDSVYMTVRLGTVTVYSYVNCIECTSKFGSFI